VERWRGRGEGRGAGGCLCMGNVYLWHFCTYDIFDIKAVVYLGQFLYLGHFVLRAIFVIRALLVLRGNFAGNVYPEKTLKVIEK